MNKILTRLRDYFISKELQEKDKNEILTTEKLLFMILAFFVFLTFYTVYFFISTPDNLIKHITNIVGTLALVLTAYSLRWTNSRTPIIIILNFVCYIFTYISLMSSGGIYSIDIEWYLLNSVATFIFIGTATGLWVSVINLVVVSSLFYLELIHLKDFKTDSVAQNGVHEYFTFVFIQLVYAFVVYYFIKALHQTKEQFDALNNQKIEELNELAEKRTQENLSLRTDIARDFHDVMGNKLASISSLSQMLQLKNNSENDTWKEEIQRINHLSKEVYDGTKDFIWALDAKHNNLFQVYFYLQDFAERLYQHTDISFESQPIDENSVNFALSSYRCSQIVLVFKEAMTNALIHSKAKSIKFFLNLSENNVSIVLSDDGIGFDPENLSRENGLLNIKQRAIKSNCLLKIESNVNKGSFIKLIIKE
jgi:signal transduction histidine kinase